MKTIPYIAGILIFVVVGVYAVHQQVTVYQLGYEIHRAQTDIYDMQEENRLLNDEIAELKKPERLRRFVADYPLPLVPPEGSDVDEHVGR